MGLRIGTAAARPAGAINHVPGVAVGHVIAWRDEPAPPAGPGLARTGVTAIAPGAPADLLDGRPPAGAAVPNGEIFGAFSTAWRGAGAAGPVADAALDPLFSAV